MLKRKYFSEVYMSICKKFRKQKLS